jgi:hypothetical protein
LLLLLLLSILDSGESPNGFLPAAVAAAAGVTAVDKDSSMEYESLKGLAPPPPLAFVLFPTTLDSSTDESPNGFVCSDGRLL